LHKNSFVKKLQSQIVISEKLRKTLLEEKAACRILVKLTLRRIFGFFHQKNLEQKNRKDLKDCRDEIQKAKVYG
jgi:hypothetical protein